MANKILIDTEVNNKGAKKGLKELEKGFDKTSKNAAKSLSVIDIALGNIAANLAVNAIGFVKDAIVGFGSAAVDQAVKIETLETQIGTLTGSSEVAKKALEDLQQFAASTPFQLEGLAEANKLLLAFGKSQEEVLPTLQILGDVAAGSGADLTELTRIFGQVSAAGKLTGERLLQFQERAIPIGPALAKTMGVAEESVKDLVSKGLVDVKTFEAAFATLNQEGGKFAGGMIKQSQTLDGLMSTLSDNVDLALGTIGKELMPGIKKAITEVLYTRNRSHDRKIIRD